MKRLTAAVFIVMTLCVSLTSQTRPAADHNLSLRGIEVSNGARGMITLVGTAKGFLQGSFEMTLRHNPTTNAVTGGTWKLTVSRPGRDGGPAVRGELAGTIEGGIVQMDEHGRVASADGVRLTIKRGKGDYSHVSGGSGEFKGSFNLRRQHPLTGELRIAF